MAFYSSYAPRMTKAEKQLKIQKSIDKLKKKNPELAPIVIEGRLIAKQWWGKAWNFNLESYADYSNRIARGRSYVLQGAVIDLQLSSGLVKAMVQGTTSAPYHIQIQIDSPSSAKWERIIQRCNRRIDTLESLVVGKFPIELETLFTSGKDGLFPTPKEIHFDCSCPDLAIMCKHVAAVLYAIGAKFDQNPLLFFTLRNIDFGALIKLSVEEKMNKMLENAEKDSSRVIAEEEVFDLFGI